MSLELIDPPEKAWQSVLDWLGAMATDGAFQTRQLCRHHIDPDKLSIGVPHPAFILPLDSIKAGGNFEQAYMVAWRYLVVQGDKVLAAADLDADGPHDHGQEVAICEGGALDRLECRLQLAECQPRVESSRYVLGLLLVPALHVEALWLRDALGRGGKDLFLPLLLPNQTPGKDKKDKLLKPASFMAVLMRCKADLAD